ncbi:MAG: aminoacyl-tRNA hydrolase [Bacteroidia bacterium]|nr:aminoacyl-tRNA hydrolase [Bacteroidia bacterium]
MKKRAIFGLGNPGELYRHTRHNVGFRVVEALASRLQAPSFSAQKYVLTTHVSWAGVQWYLFQPTTYMNLSGEAVAYWKQRLSLSTEEILVVLDEIQLPVGSMRLTPKGSAGGHNGLSHIIDCLETPSFPRLRIGIGKDFPRGKQVEYVLSPFTPEQERLFLELLPRAVDCILIWGRNDIERAMNHCNQANRFGISGFPTPSKKEQ